MFFLIFLFLSSWSVQAQEPASSQNTVSSLQARTSPDQFIGKKTGVHISQARPEDVTPENYPYHIEEFKFSAAPLKSVIETMSRTMNINLIMDPKLVGAGQTIDIIHYSSLNVAEYYHVFLSILALNNLTALRSGPFLKVVNSETALKSNLRVHTGDQKINTDQFLTTVIKLKHINPETLQTHIKPFIDAKSVTSLIVYPPSNAVIISGYGSNLNKIRSIIKSLDIPSQDSIFEVLPIRHAQANKLVEIINKLLPSRQSHYRYRPSKSKTSSGQQTVNISSLSHDERTNSIIVMGNKAGVRQVKDLVRRLDYHNKSDLAGGIYVYKVKHGTAEELANTLNELMGKASGAKGGGQGKGPAPKVVTSRSPYGTAKMQNMSTALAFEDINIIAEKTTNSLLIVANKNNYKSILDILNKVDISRNQVFVRSIIMEMNTDKSNDWKIANYFFPKDGGGLTRMGYGLSNFTEITNSKEGSATLFFPLSLFLGKSFSNYPKSDIKGLLSMSGISNLPDTVEVPTLSSFVRFLQKNTGANILSTPQVMALDHQKAEVSIVNKIPRVTSRTQGTGVYPGQVATGHDEVTTSLIFTPHINPDVNSIRLEIEQKIDDVLPSTDVPEELQGSSKAIKQRLIKTFITLKDKETAVLGGLVRESNTQNEQKIPILGDLPLIGWLFKNSDTERKKTNLVVFVTPHIIRSAKEHKSILSAKLQERMNFIQKFTGGKDPYKEVIDQMQSTEDATSYEPDPVESTDATDYEPDPVESTGDSTDYEPPLAESTGDSADYEPPLVSEPKPLDSAFSEPAQEPEEPQNQALQALEKEVL